MATSITELDSIEDLSRPITIYGQEPKNDDEPEPVNNDEPGPVNDDEPEPVNDDEPKPENNDEPEPDNDDDDVPAKVSKQNSKGGEMVLEDLPKIEELFITVPEKDIEKIGTISSIVSPLVVIQSIKNLPPLDLDTVLFLDHDKPLGHIFDVLGPVIQPFYTVRFNSLEEIIKKEITKGLPVYFAPTHEKLTSLVFVDKLKCQKGSDASWADNTEPPEECLDFSDDEEERRIRQGRKRHYQSTSTYPYFQDYGSRNSSRTSSISCDSLPYNRFSGNGDQSRLIPNNSHNGAVSLQNNYFRTFQQRQQPVLRSQSENRFGRPNEPFTVPSNQTPPMRQLHVQVPNQRFGTLPYNNDQTFRDRSFNNQNFGNSESSSVFSLQSSNYMPQCVSQNNSSLRELYDASIPPPAIISSTLPPSFVPPPPQQRPVYMQQQSFPHVVQQQSFPSVVRQQAFPPVVHQQSIPPVVHHQVVPQQSFTQVVPQLSYPPVVQQQPYLPVVQQQSFRPVVQQRPYLLPPPPQITQAVTTSSYMPSIEVSSNGSSYPFMVARNPQPAHILIAPSPPPAPLMFAPSPPPVPVMITSSSSHRPLVAHATFPPQSQNFCHFQSHNFGP